MRFDWPRHSFSRNTYFCTLPDIDVSAELAGESTPDAG
jgi:hypothetical protein